MGPKLPVKSESLTWTGLHIGVYMTCLASAFSISQFSQDEIFEAVANMKRPSLESACAVEVMRSAPEDWLPLLRSCWDQDPAKRPTVAEMAKRLHAMGPKSFQELEVSIDRHPDKDLIMRV